MNDFIHGYLDINRNRSITWGWVNGLVELDHSPAYIIYTKLYHMNTKLAICPPSPVGEPIHYHLFIMFRCHSYLLRRARWFTGRARSVRWSMSARAFLERQPPYGMENWVISAENSSLLRQVLSRVQHLCDRQVTAKQTEVVFHLYCAFHVCSAGHVDYRASLRPRRSQSTP